MQSKARFGKGMQPPALEPSTWQGGEGYPLESPKKPGVLALKQST